MITNLALRERPFEEETLKLWRPPTTVCQSSIALRAVGDFGYTADKIEFLKEETVVGTLEVNRTRPDVAAAVPQFRLTEAGFEGTVPRAAVARLPSITLRLTIAGIKILRRIDLASRQVSPLH
jgi:hypothetical protein